MSCGIGGLARGCDGTSRLGTETSYVRKEDLGGFRRYGPAERGLDSAAPEVADCCWRPSALRLESGFPGVPRGVRPAILPPPPQPGARVCVCACPCVPVRPPPGRPRLSPGRARQGPLRGGPARVPSTARPRGPPSLSRVPAAAWARSHRDSWTRPAPSCLSSRESSCLSCGTFSVTAWEQCFKTSERARRATAVSVIFSDLIFTLMPCDPLSVHDSSSNYTITGCQRFLTFTQALCFIVGKSVSFEFPPREK